MRARRRRRPRSAGTLCSPGARQSTEGGREGGPRRQLRGDLVGGMSAWQQRLAQAQAKSLEKTGERVAGDSGMHVVPVSLGKGEDATD